MATAKSPAKRSAPHAPGIDRFAELKARVEGHRHELIRSDEVYGPVTYFIFDPHVRKVTCVIGGTLSDVEHWCEHYDSPDDVPFRPAGC